MDVLLYALELCLHLLVGVEFLVEFVSICVFLKNLLRELLDQDQTQHREVEICIVSQFCQYLCKLELLLGVEVPSAREEQQLVYQSLAQAVLDLVVRQNFSCFVELLADCGLSDDVPPFFAQVDG